MTTDEPQDGFETVALRAMIDRVEQVIAKYTGDGGVDHPEVDAVLDDLRTALRFPDVDKWLNDAERGLPFIVQVMQGQYLSMTNTMNAQVEIANEQRKEAQAALLVLFDGLTAFEHKLQEIGVYLATDDLESTIASVAGQVSVARTSLAQEAS